MHLLNVIFYCMAAVSIIGLVCLIVNWARYMEQRNANAFPRGKRRAGFPIKSIVAFLGAALLAGLIATNVTAISRREVLKFIYDAQALTIYVNSQPAPNSDEIVAALKTLQPVAAHHSHPTTMIKIELHSDSDVVTLECGRDSSNAREYWVFYPKYGVTSNNEIGRITTSALDPYK